MNRIIMLALTVCLLPLNANAATKKVKSAETPKEALYVCGINIILGMHRDEVNRAVAGCDIQEVSGSSSIFLKRSKDILGVVSFNESNRVISAYRDWFPSNSSASELIKTLAEAINSLPENVRVNNSVNTHNESQPEFNTNSVNIWFQGHRSIRLETLELKRDGQSSVSIREYLQEHN